MRVGVVMLPTDPWPESLARARRVDALGFAHLWTYDHLSWRRYRERPWFAAIPWLTGVAVATERIRVAPMVATPNYRHPLTLAKEAMTLDHVSGGRFLLALGAGGLGFDATVLGAEPLTPRERVDRLDEFADVVDRLLREPAVTVRGPRYVVDDARMHPGCVQQPRLPIAIAAGGPRAISIAARRGDAWVTYGDTSERELTVDGMYDALRRQVDQLEHACAAIDRDPSSIDRILLTGQTDLRPLASVAAFTDFVGRAADLGFTDVVVHHPRADDPAWDDDEAILDDVAALLPSLSGASRRSR